MKKIKSLLKKSAIKTGKLAISRPASPCWYHEVTIPQELLKLKKEITKKTV